MYQSKLPHEYEGEKITSEELQEQYETKIEKLIKDLAKDKKYNKFNDNQAADMAQSILDDNEGLEAGIEKVYRVRDAAGWLADKI